MSAAEGLGQLINVIAKQRQDRLETTLAAKQSMLIDDLRTRAFSKIENDYNNKPLDQFSVEDQTKWYDTEIDKLVSGVSDETRRLKFKSTLEAHRATFAMQAQKYEIQAQKELQKTSINASKNRAITSMLDAYQVGDIDEVNNALFDYTIQNTFNKTYFTNEALEDLRSVESDVVSMSTDLKMGLVHQQYVNGQIEEDEYKAALDKELTLLNSMDIDANRKLVAFTTAQSQKARLIQKSDSDFVQRIKRDFDGEKERLMGGLGFSKGYEKDLYKAYEKDNSLAPLIMEVEAVKNASEFYDARLNGDTQKMYAEYARLTREKNNSSGKQFQILSDTVGRVGTDLQKAEKLRLENLAEFLKGNRRLSTLKIIGERKADMSEYVNTLVSFGQAYGDDVSSIEFLDKTDTKQYKALFKQIGSTVDGARTFVNDIKRRYNVPLGNGRMAYENVLGQLIGDDQDPQIQALRFIDEPEFPSIWEGAKLTSKELGGIFEQNNTTVEKVKDAISKTKSWTRFRNSLESQGLSVDELNKHTSTQYNAIIRSVASSLADPLINDINQAVGIAIDTILKYEYTDSGKWGIYNKLRIPKGVLTNHQVKQIKHASPQRLLQSYFERASGSLTMALDEKALVSKIDLPEIALRDEPWAGVITDPIKIKHAEAISLLDQVIVSTAPDESGIAFYYRNTKTGRLYPLRFKGTGIAKMNWGDIFPNLEKERVNK